MVTRELMKAVTRKWWGWKQVTKEDQEDGDEVLATVLKDDSLVKQKRGRSYKRQGTRPACFFPKSGIHLRENYCIIFLVIISQMASSSISNLSSKTMSRYA